MSAQSSTQPQYQRVHRLTPLLRVWTTLLALLAIAAFNFTMPIYHWLEEVDVGLTDAAWALGAAVLALMGKKNLEKIKGLPQTQETLQEIPETLNPAKETR